MSFRILAAFVFSLGLIASGAFADGKSATDNRGCPDIRKQIDNYADCQSDNVNGAYGVHTLVVRQRVAPGTIGDFIDETVEEKNQRPKK